MAAGTVDPMTPEGPPPSEGSAPVDGLAAVTSLGEPTRRILYDFVAASGGWVSRDQAADAAGLERATAARHLDRLATDGLLDVRFQRLTGRTGPGAGRPAKLYRRAIQEFDVSLPPRRYDMAGELLADAADRSRRDGSDMMKNLDAVAADAGRRMVDDVRLPLANNPFADRPGRRAVVVRALGEHGFEPVVAEDGVVVLRNCPFHQLAQRHTELICGMNLGLITAALDALGVAGLEARLEPIDGACCVQLHPTP
ncbi:MAG: transcriptional regulator [Aquihabitans sp.]